MHIVVTPSRILNDQRGVFGLWMTDFAGAIGVFVFLSSLLDGTRFAIAALPAAILSLALIIPLRLSTRRKIIRDTIAFALKPRLLFQVRKHAVRT